MKRLLSILIAPLLILNFVGCSEECDDPDVAAINALYFECDQGADGFSEEALNELFIVRFVPFSEPLVADTVFLNGDFPSGKGRFFINDQFPFVNGQSPYFTIYGYQVVDPTTGYVGNIENIELEGEYDGDCGYNNLAKKFTFNNEEVDLGGTQNFYLITP
ncbi:MAG: hypothetical protein MK086_12740 [Flavobacteriales bacterium]|nr:hypothetical protein [Flavobacteriales bacterium]